MAKVLFRDRAQAGEQLAELVVKEISELMTKRNVFPVVYALPRGGIPVAAPIARQLGCPMDVIVAKKITTTDNQELALGAVTASGQVLWANQGKEGLESELQTAQEKAIAQLEQFSPYRPFFKREGEVAIIVDDGIATGMTMAVAVQSAKLHNPNQIWICAPVAPRELRRSLRKWSDRAITLHTPHPFYSVSRFYESFPQLETEKAVQYLQRHNRKFDHI